MAFDARVNTALLPAMLLHLGEAATYTPLAGDPVEIMAVRDLALQLRPGETTKSQGQGNRWRISFAAGLVMPARGDAIDFDDAEYLVSAVDADDGGLVSVIAIKQAA